MRRFLAGLVLWPAAAMTQTPPPGSSGPAAPPPCSQPAARAFDFWLGRWEVFDPQGAKAGDSRIDAVLGGCVIHEQWQGRGGFEGMSFNSVDAKGRWMQHWVDNRGGRLNLVGGLDGSSMVLSSLPDAAAPAGHIDRIRWTPLPGGGVRQLWQRSTDAGATWSVVFDGEYRRRP